MSDRVFVRVGTEEIDPAEVLAFVADPSSGATCLFLGTARDHSAAGPVSGLQYEAWEELAIKRMGEIATEMFDKWELRRAALVHRTGDLKIGDVSVAVAGSASHREEAFEACRHGIERIKEDVPIWKKERLAGGESQWVSGS
ncbi:MAG: molybdenum cofactor biosynthesis protein MoaE [Actinomycetota bacterium]